MLTEYDIQKTARAIVDLLLEDDRFIKRIMKASPRKGSKMFNSRQAASYLGISQYTLRHIAPYIGGIKKGVGKQSKWTFEEEGLKERYLEYLNDKK